MSNRLLPPGAIVNLAAYRFAKLEDLPVLRTRLLSSAEAAGLRGTILLSREGINLFVAGDRAGVDRLMREVRQVPGLGDIETKESYSDEIPFNRMLVKIKREIISFGVPGIDPERVSTKRISPRQLRDWLRAGKRVRLLDTRNRFEVAVGTFANAHPVGIDDFRSFPDAAAGLPASMKQETIVTFCTGGIRCEKAGPYLEQAGFEDVYQLDGGILKYFEECGGEFFEGQCFVFDKRVALDAELRAGDWKLCFACQALLTAEEGEDPAYVEGESCPHCVSTGEKTLRVKRAVGETPTDELDWQAVVTERNRTIAAFVDPLPGSRPYNNRRPISVPQRCDRMELLQFFAAMRTHLLPSEWETACLERRVLYRGEPVFPGRIVRGGERFVHLQSGVTEPDVATEIRVLFEDDVLVLLHKPAPLPMHPCGRFHRNTLGNILGGVYQPDRLRLVHRLDADTSGVVVFSKTREAARKLQQQFRAGEVEKHYVALVHGSPPCDEFESRVPLSERPGERGIRLSDPAGAAACTTFRVLRRTSGATTLLEAEPRTGRTNQIRAHLWYAGFPIVGDPIYLPEGKLGRARTLSKDEPPLCLHAARVRLRHPESGEPVQQTSPWPKWGLEG